jgi:macrolide-specific efflux system membrane fusion protein
MKKPVRTRYTVLIALLLIAVAGAAAKYWLFPAKTEPNYITQPVQIGDLEDTVLATGTLQPYQLVSVGAQVSGQIQTLHVALGDRVHKGDLIAEIDPSTQQNALDDAKASLANVKAQRAAKEAVLKEAKLTYARQQRMHKLNASAQEDLESAEATLNQTKAEIAALDAQIEQAKIAVDTAQIDLGYTKILAPMDGTVVSTPVKAGQTVNAVQTTPTIIKLARLDKMTVEAQVSEADVIRVKPGQDVYFTILGDPDTRYRAKLRSIEPAPEQIDTEDDITDSDGAIYYNALFDVPNPDRRLRIWMTAEVTIVLQSVKDAITIPSSALHGPDNNGTYYVEIPGPDGTAQRRDVTVGLNTNVRAEIKSGLTKDDKVIVGASSGVIDSEKRRPRGMMF